LVTSEHEREGISAAPTAETPWAGEFVAVNFISCIDSYRGRFEELFRSRAHAIDQVPGFRRMVVLRPEREGGDYLVVSFWDDRSCFDGWRASDAFTAGHTRGFGDLKAARERGEQPPMSSRMETYGVLCE
jgi:heme-degrading monooxygenase HmoA